MRHKYVQSIALAALLSLLPMAAAAAEVESGSVYCFRAEDFSGADRVSGICLRTLPEGKLGAVMLGTRILRPGDILTAQQIDQMTFCPADTESDGAALITYLPICGNTVQKEAALSLGIRGKEDQPPVAEDSAVETYKNLPNTAKLKTHDPEGQTMTYTVIRQPRRGTVTIGEDGSFTYTPKKNKIGVDSFTFTATDPAGKVSREATVTITILKPTDAAQYQDTVGKDCRFAAEWMKHTGIFVGEKVGDQSCFYPDRSVTRGEFLTMLVKTLDLPVEEQVTLTGDDTQIPDWLKPYLAAAIRSGLTADLPEQLTYSVDAYATGTDAAVLVCNALDIPVIAGDEIPWEDRAVSVALGRGFDLEADLPLTRAQAAKILYEIYQTIHFG